MHHFAVGFGKQASLPGPGDGPGENPGEEGEADGADADAAAPGEAAGPAPPAEDDLTGIMADARAKFDELDANGSGTLEGDELIGLGEWIWTAFHPGGRMVSNEDFVSHYAWRKHAFLS